jgi:hypothetical protein
MINLSSFAKQLDSLGGDQDVTFIAYVESEGLETISQSQSQRLQISTGRYENWATVYTHGIMSWEESKDYAATYLGFSDLIEDHNG